MERREVRRVGGARRMRFNMVDRFMVGIVGSCTFPIDVIFCSKYPGTEKLQASKRCESRCWKLIFALFSQSRNDSNSFQHEI
jgi:hypothetical protein